MTPIVADRVVAGTLGLNEAYKEADALGKRAQRAMALAMIAPEKDQRGRGKNSKILLFCDGDERNAMRVALNKARLVLKVKPLLAAEVLSGMLPLDNAYKQADADLKAEAEEVDPISDLRKRRPDLADQVANEELSLANAN